jgi:cell division protein FtsW (lipid II flippase)
MFIISTAIILVVTLEAVFIAYTSWWLMGLVLVLVIAAAIGVCSALVRLIDHDTALARPQLWPQPAAAPAPAPAPAPAARPVPAPTHRAAITH